MRLPTRELQIETYDPMSVMLPQETIVQRRGEILRAMVDPSFVRTDLVDLERTLTAITTPQKRGSASPSHWLALLVNNQPYGLTSEQFGTGDDQEATKDRQLMHQVVQQNAARIGSDRFFSHGGLLVERVRRAGQGIFAVLEMGNVYNEEGTIKFVTLSFPRALVLGSSKRVTPKPHEFTGCNSVAEAITEVFSAFSAIPPSTHPTQRRGYN